MKTWKEDATSIDGNRQSQNDSSKSSLKGLILLIGWKRRIEDMIFVYIMKSANINYGFQLAVIQLSSYDGQRPSAYKIMIHL